MALERTRAITRALGKNYASGFMTIFHGNETRTLEELIETRARLKSDLYPNHSKDVRLSVPLQRGLDSSYILGMCTVSGLVLGACAGVGYLFYESVKAAGH